MGLSSPRADELAAASPSAADEATAWAVLLAAARLSAKCAAAAKEQAFSPTDGPGLRAVPADDPAAMIVWRPGTGWVTCLPPELPQATLLDLYLPICSATPAAPITVGHLGQSLDGFIATHTGDSQFVTGPDNLRHMHRMRALCDAIVVGAGTVAADDPQLTTRQVTGPNPVRVIFDPKRRLDAHYRVFTDAAVETLYVCARSQAGPDERSFGGATLVPLDDEGGQVDLSAVIGLLRARGCHRIFIEGGGVTVSSFLEADLLDRLQVAVAPLIIGDGRPAIRLPQPPAALGDCHRPRYRVFRMGGDILFDCDLRAVAEDADRSAPGLLSRVI